VLVAEDNRLNQQVVCEFLARAGAGVAVAGNGLEAVEVGLEAVEVARLQSFDAVLMDMQMPVMDGLQAARELRKIPHFADTPIIALTANVFRTDIEQCIAAGMNDHIGKPIKVDDLFAKLEKWLANPVLKPVDKVSSPSARTVPITDSQPKAQWSIPGLDIAAARDRLGGDDVLLGKVLGLFRQTEAESPLRIRAALAAGRAALAAGDAELCQRLAHTLKSTAGSVGANRLQAAARVIEETIRACGSVGEELLGELETAHAEAMAGLDSLDSNEERR